MATKTRDLAVTHLTKGAHCDFHTRVDNLVTATGPEKLHLEALAPDYHAAVKVEASIVNRETTFVATATMKEADQRRDYLLSTFNSVVNAHQWNPIAAKKESYIFLNALLAPYKNIREHEYSRETSEVTGLVEALGADEAMPHVTTLGLTEELAALAQANAAFAMEFDKKVQELAERAPQSDIDTREARQACDTLYYQLCDLVNAYALIQPTDEIIQFINQLNGIIAAFDSIADNTGKKKKEESEAPSDSPTGEETETPENAGN